MRAHADQTTHAYECLINGKPTSDLLYVPDALSRDVESHFLSTLYAGPQPQPCQTSRLGLPSKCGRWQVLRSRRLVMFGGEPDVRGMIREDILSWAIDPFRDAALQHLGHLVTIGATDATFEIPPIAEPNHILINEYISPHGISFHEDGPLYHPAVMIFSLQSALALRFRPKSGEPSEHSVILEPRSMIVFRGDMYNTWLHGIIDAPQDIVPRSTCSNIHQLGAMGVVSDEDADQLRVSRGPRRVSVTLRTVLSVVGRKRDHR